MKRRIQFLILLMLVLFSCNDEKQEVPIDFDKSKALELVNDLREKGTSCAGELQAPVQTLIWNDLLEQAAQRHCDDMQENGIFDHVGSDGSTWIERVTGTGYQWQVCGENIMAGTEMVETAISAWEKSSEHCINIMDGEYREIGIARKGTYWTMVLASQ